MWKKAITFVNILHKNIYHTYIISVKLKIGENELYFIEN